MPNIKNVWQKMLYYIKILIMKRHKKHSCFTLVELIVVVVILAVLAVISMLTVSSWIWKSKDSKRISDVKSLQNWIEIKRWEVWDMYYPSPDIPITISTNQNWVLWYQWKIWTWLTKRVWNYNKKVMDSSWQQYEYSISADKKYYQITAYLENEKKVSILQDKVYTQDQYAYVLTNYMWYLIAQEDWWKYTLLQTDSMQIDPKKIANSVSWDVYKTTLQNEIIKNGSNEYTSAITWDITNLFDADDWNNYATMQTIDTKFASISSPEQVWEVLKIASWNPNDTVIEAVATNCTGQNYSWYTYDALLHWGSQTKSKSVVIVNGAGSKSMSATCNNWNLVYWTESLSITCNSGYVESAWSCIADLCQWTLPANAQLNWTQSVAGTWDYSTSSWVCKFQCDANYSRDGTACNHNAVNWVCWTSHGQTFTTTPSLNLCLTGNASSITTNSTTYTWTCNGLYWWTNANCSANRLKGIVWDDTSWRNWADWTYATKCNSYYSPSWWYAYTWSIGDGFYWIDINGWDSADKIKVYCNMTISGWWRMLAVKIWWTVASDRTHLNPAAVWTLTSVNQWTTWKFTDSFINSMKTVWFIFVCNHTDPMVIGSSCVFGSTTAANSACMSPTAAYSSETRWFNWYYWTAPYWPVYWYSPPNTIWWCFSPVDGAHNQPGWVWVK